MDEVATMKDLQDAYRDVMDQFTSDGIRVTIERAVSFSSDEVKYGLRIERERQTSSGRQGKPTPLVMLINNPGETPTAMLRILADIFDAAMKADTE